MSLKALIAGAARTAFLAAGDVPRSVVLLVNPSNTYVAASDSTVTTWEHSITIPDAIVFEREQTQGKDKAPVGTEQKAVIQAVRIAPLTAEQVPETSILQIGSDDWQVLSVEPDPAGATLTLSLRLG